jgi:phage pi2 protein 07
VIKNITRSAAQQANFNCVAQQLNVKVSPLIAGYRICWNIKYQSYRKAIKAQAVINQILKEDQLRKGVGVFDGIFFFPKDWQEI